MQNKIYSKIYLLLICIISIFSSCVSTEEVNYLQDIETSYKYKPYKEYKLKLGDYVSCKISTGDKSFADSFDKLISENPTEVRSYLIYENGAIILPYFGEVEVLGLTLQEAEQKVQKMLRESLTDAYVNMDLTNNHFYILANDKRGTFVAYKENMTIYQALAISGQTTTGMDLSKVTIVRQNENGTTMQKKFDLRTQDIVQSEYYYIYPNDLIYFPTSKNAFFNVTSLSSFFGVIMAPISFLIIVLSYGR